MVELKVGSCELECGGLPLVSFRPSELLRFSISLGTGTSMKLQAKPGSRVIMLHKMREGRSEPGLQEMLLDFTIGSK